MDAKQTIAHIAELCEDAKNNPQYLTFATIAEWCHKQMNYMNHVSLVFGPISVCTCAPEHRNALECKCGAWFRETQGTEE